MPTERGHQVFVETVSLFQLCYRTAHGIQNTKSEGQALRVSLVKPGAYLSASYHQDETGFFLYDGPGHHTAGDRVGHPDLNGRGAQ